MLRSTHFLLRSTYGENEMPKAVQFSRLLPSDPLQLHSVEEWLRGFREQRLPNLPNVVYCRKCGIRLIAYPDTVTITQCYSCGLPVQRLDEVFWQRLSNRIKQHYRKDPLLFARLNAEVVFPPAIPDLDGSLAWVMIEWRKAAMPPGRPRHLERQLSLGFWLNALARPRLVMEHGGHPSELWIFESSGNPQRLFPQVSSGSTPQPPRSQVLPPIMTLSGAIEVLTGNNLKQAIDRRVPWRRPQLFGGLSIRSLMQIRSAFRKQWHKQFGRFPTLLVRREAERILALQRNFQSGGKIRVKGIKLREKPSRKKEEASGDRAEPPVLDVNKIVKKYS
jgi:ribosomal protein L37E